MVNREKREYDERLFLRDDRACCGIDPVGHGPVKQVECIDLQVNEVLEIEGLEPGLAIHFIGDRDVVPHPLAGLDVVHTVRWNPGMMKLAMGVISGNHGSVPATVPHLSENPDGGRKFSGKRVIVRITTGKTRKKFFNNCSIILI